MKFILLSTMLALLHSQSQASLLDWLPANARTVVMVNDFHNAVNEYPSTKQPRFGNSFQERFAMAPDEVAELIAGQFLRAEFIFNDGTSGEVAVARAVADIDHAINKIHGRLKQQQAKVTVTSFGSHQGHVIARERADGSNSISVHLIHEGHLLLADNLAVANAITTHIDATDRVGLAEKQGFREVWKQCSPQLNGEALAIAWYTDPWREIHNNPRAAENNEAFSKEYRFAERHGMTGVIGLGGSIVFGTSGEQNIQAFAYAPQPLTSSLRMAAHLTGTHDITLPAWISKVVSEVVVLHGNMDKALEHAGLLFDDGFAEGVVGTYEEVLLDLNELLELDLKKELYPLLGPQIYLIHGTAENREWQPLVVAFEVKNAARVAEILRILIADDPEATEVLLGDESDRAWRVPGKRGGRDFVLGMLRGVAVYANDLEFAKSAMRFNQSEGFLTADQLAASRDRATKGLPVTPSMLIARRLSPEDQASAAHPLDLVFQGARFFADRETEKATSMQWLPRRLTVLLAGHGLIVGFAEQDGWKFVARTGGRAEQQCRVFTDSTGRKAVAKIVRATDEKVTLERIDGRQFTVPVDIFSLADQEFIRGMLNVAANKEAR